MKNITLIFVLLMIIMFFYCSLAVVFVFPFRIFIYFSFCYFFFQCGSCENIMTCPMREIGSGSNHCPYDWLAVYDGRDEHAPLIGKFCGVGKFPYSIIGKCVIKKCYKSVVCSSLFFYMFFFRTFEI